ncbi:MAG: hypothetical protein HKN00_10705 [Flavobacteriaceae bacterium]|nr:hypothetical protein [Bacteroidia bacterium]NNF75647.1 hypothetical protein [Flavobacteriaceae bacterium]NNK71635.1 hypothetical protein [Flavobacteriaceae bacterium]
MQIITKSLAVFIILFSLNSVYSQDTTSSDNSYKIEQLEKKKDQIKAEERSQLKAEVEAIMGRLDRGEIDEAEANKLKNMAAEKHAANIENRLAIVDNKIALLKRNQNDTISDDDDPGFSIRVGKNDGDDSYIHLGSRESKPRKYDRRTTSDLVFAIGFNNALIDGQDLDDSPYKLGGSGFVELGWAWKTRVLDNSNAIRLKYGFSLMWNKLHIKDNQYLVRDRDEIFLEPFPGDLRKAKFRTTNLVFPVHFEFGPSKRIERDNYFRYTTRDQFKIGLGGYAGFNMATLQKLKYRSDGRDVKDKFKGGYNTTEFVYGLSGYIAFDDIALYVKYDLSPIFKDQAVEQNNISLGLRFDVD